VSPEPTRRELLQLGGYGALAAGLGPNALQPDGGQTMASRPGHFSGADRVIWIFMNGGPSQVDTFDYKPALERYDGKSYDGFDKLTGFFPEEVGPLMKSPFKFAQHGESGTWMSELFPRLGQQVDDMAFMYGCHAESNNHSPALLHMNTGMPRAGFPSVGSWVLHGRGSENDSLPGFVVMTDTKGRGLPKGYAQNWSAGFLPGVFQGTALATQGDPIANLVRTAGMSEEAQLRQLDLIRRLNERHGDEVKLRSELEARTASFELARRMQSSAPEALDVDSEPAHIRELYGLDDPRCKEFARQCITARRLVERGVRFVHLYSGGEENQKSWDGHLNIESHHRGFAGEFDRPVAALLQDLKQRGLFDNTAVVCCGEFGRLPVAQKKENSETIGRDHNPDVFTAWMAGAGVKGGAQHGASDEVGHKAAEGKVHVNDLHATMLHLVGLDHERLTYRYSGRDFRLTDVAGEVVREVLS